MRIELPHCERITVYSSLSGLQIQSSSDHAILLPRRQRLKTPALRYPKRGPGGSSDRRSLQVDEDEHRRRRSSCCFPDMRGVLPEGVVCPALFSPSKKSKMMFLVTVGSALPNP